MKEGNHLKWFKHYTDNHRGRSIQNLLDQLGHTGLCYFLLVEMCAEKLEKDENGLTEADCLFSFHSRIVRQNLRISPTNLRRLLDICGANGLLSFEFSGSSLQIKMPILLNLLERNTKKAQRTRIESAQKTHLDIDIDKDIDIDIDISTEQKSVAVVDAKTINKHFLDIKPSLIKSWADTYPREFLEMELKKAKSWLLANTHKAPKKNYGRFLNSWFDRGWEQYRKTLTSNKPGKINADDLSAWLRGEL